MNYRNIFIGEIIGTFILVFIGCGSISLAIIYELLNSLLEVAFCWTIAVILGIYASLKLSGAHLNPAVSIAFFIDNQINFKTYLIYFSAQLIGALLSGLVLIQLTIILQKN